MHVLKRTLLYVSRKWHQSLILFLVLLVVSTSVLTGFAILHASHTAAANLRRQLGGTFRLETDTDNPAHRKNLVSTDQYSATYYAGDVLDNDDIDEVMKTSGISEYSASIEAVANLKSGDGAYYDLVENGHGSHTSFPHMAAIGAWSSLEQCPYFANHLLEVTQGELITDDGTGQAVVSRELAMLNRVEIGDKLTLEINREVVGFEVPAKRQQCTFEIVGIFDIRGEQQINQYTLSRQLLQNRVFVDARTMLPFLRGCTEELGMPVGYDEITFSVDDPAEMDSILQSLQENEAINWECFKITVDNAGYQGAESALKSMDGGIRGMIFAIAAVGGGALVLLLGIWAKSRIHETGILLALGRSKGEILVQRLAESALIALLALGASWVCSGMAANEVGNRLLAQVNRQSGEETKKDSQYSGMPFSAADFDLTPVFSAPKVEELDVELSGDMFASVCAAELLIVLLCAGTAGISVMKTKPKAILTEYE